MTTVSTVDRALNIALEVASYRPDYSEQIERTTKDLIADRGTADIDGDSESETDRNSIIGYVAYAALGHSHAVIQQTDQRLAPRGRVAALTRRTLAMTAFAGSPMLPALDKVFDECCMAAELKFVHGLEYHRLGRRPSPSHVAALVLHDVEGRPCAYQKAVGLSYAYVWRDSVMQTRAGLRSLLAGSIIEPTYSHDSHGQLPLGKKFAGAGLVGISGCVADDIEFKRFSLQLIPKKIRTIALLDASTPDTYGEYRHYVGEAVAMNDTVFAASVAEIVKSTGDYFVAEIPLEDR